VKHVLCVVQCADQELPARFCFNLVPTVVHDMNDIDWPIKMHIESDPSTHILQRNIDLLPVMPSIRF
jgi:hypothetical protein